jgi:UDP-glucose 4-epimerase
VVEAYLRLLKSDRTGDVVNICSGRSVSLMEVIDEMARIAKYRPQITVDPAFVRSDEVKELYGSPAKLFEIVGNIDVPSLHETLLSMYEQKASV